MKSIGHLFGHYWTVYERSEVMRLRDPGLVGGFFAAIWGPGLGYTGGRGGNYAKVVCVVCKKTTVFEEFGERSKNAGTKLEEKGDEVTTLKPDFLNDPNRWKPVTK